MFANPELLAWKPEGYECERGSRRPNFVCDRFRVTVGEKAVPRTGYAQARMSGLQRRRRGDRNAVGSAKEKDRCAQRFAKALDELDSGNAFSQRIAQNARGPHDAYRVGHDEIGGVDGVSIGAVASRKDGHLGTEGHDVRRARIPNKRRNSICGFVATDAIDAASQDVDARSLRQAAAIWQG